MSHAFAPGFLIGIGSNLSPHQHIGEIITALTEQFPKVSLSRVLQIPPIGMNSQNDFLNLVVFVETDWPQQQLKDLCNSIEIRLGRDRSDPDRKIKDRTADLDILLAISEADKLSLPMSQITDEYFLYPLIDELFAFLAGKPFNAKQVGVGIQHHDLTFGKAATTINRDTTAGQKRISQ